MATFLLVHGAWHGAWCWEHTVPALEAAGHRALALDLPGHGEDQTPPGDVTLAMYAAAVCDAARSAGEPVVCVGHSMGGVVITQAAHDEPELFSLLVYLAAFPPLEGESLSVVSSRDSESLISTAVESDPPTLRFRPERAREIFYADCSDDVVLAAESRLRPNPSRPMTEPVALPRGVSLPCAYVECTRDRAISIGAQRELAARIAPVRVISLESSHSPFYSMPDELAEHLSGLASLSS